MTALPDVRGTRSARVTAFVAVAVFVPITAATWIAWQVLEDGRSTLTSSAFQQWAWVTLGAAVLTCLTAGVLAPSRQARLGILAGLLLAVVAVAVGLWVDIQSSGGFA